MIFFWLILSFFLFVFLGVLYVIADEGKCQFGSRRNQSKRSKGKCNTFSSIMHLLQHARTNF